MGKNRAFLQCYLKQVFWKIMPGKGYIYLLLNNPNTWGKSLQFGNSRWAHTHKNNPRREKITVTGGTVVAPFLCSLPNAPLPLLAKAYLFFSPSTHLIFLFSSRSFCKSSPLTMWLVELYDTLAACRRVFPEHSPLFRKPLLLPRAGGWQRRGREWERGKCKQLTKTWEPKKTSAHKNRCHQLYPIHT